MYLLRTYVLTSNYYVGSCNSATIHEFKEPSEYNLSDTVRFFTEKDYFKRLILEYSFSGHRFVFFFLGYMR